MKIEPLNDKQDQLMKALFDQSMVIGIGSAGTGKTFVTSHVAAEKLIDKEIKRIIVTRPNVPTGRTLGSFPGTVDDKLAPWLLPTLNDLERAFDAGPAAFKNRLGKSILLQPLETIRGSSFEDAFVIVDEAQNLNTEELKAITTRIGKNTTLALIGDPKQSDVKQGNDLLNFAHLCHKHDINIPIIEFGIGDVVRSELVKSLLTMFEEEGI